MPPGKYPIGTRRNECVIFIFTEKVKFTSSLYWLEPRSDGYKQIANRLLEAQGTEAQKS
jgi:hypothetical protein